MTDPILDLNRALEGKYRIESELGTGGMATVYLADDLRHGRQVALKVLKPEVAAAIGCDRFLAEIKTTAQLQHPHILPLHDSGRIGRRPFYVMPYVAGESLRAKLDREGPLPIEEALDLAQKVGRALQAAHDRGIVHRDVKPGNILLSGSEPQVADFGIALALGSADTERLTETGVSLGTPHYMSPEQVRADRVPDHRSDVYALASVLYEMLGGEPPFYGKTSAGVLVRVLSEAPRPIRSVRPAVPPHVEAALIRALEKIPGDRFPTVGEFVAALADTAYGAPEAAAPARAPRSLAARVLTGVGALVVLIVAGRALMDGRQAGPMVESPPPASSERPSVAVLPFTNLSADSSNAFFTAGVHESVLLTLSQIASIDVSALQAVRSFADTELAPEEVARRLGVSSLMSGSVQRDADQVRIIVALVDPFTGNQLWSEGYDRRLEDVFGVQSEIAQAVARSFRAVLTPVEQSRISRRPTEALSALDSYMRGRQAYLELSLEAMNEAIRHYEQALAVDPQFALAWAGLADAMLQRVQFFGYPPAWADSAQTLAEHAIALDPELPEAHKTLGFVHSMNARPSAALQAAERALELRPGFANALNNAGWSRYLLGDLVGAEERVRGAFRLLPTVPQLRSNVGAMLAILGRAEEAEEWLDAVLAEVPELTAARNWRVFLDVARGDPGGALARAEAYLDDESPPEMALARAAFAALLARDTATAFGYAQQAHEAVPVGDLFELRRIQTMTGFLRVASGAPEGGEALIRESIEAVERGLAAGADGWDPYWELASAHAALGQGEEALDYLDLAVERGFPHAILLRLDPTFDAVRSDARFEAAARSVEERTARLRRDTQEG